jgi:hypothetical protein
VRCPVLPLSQPSLRLWIAPTGESDVLFGTAVIVAAPIAAKAAAGEILAANVLQEPAAGKGFLFSDRGDTALRAFLEKRKPTYLGR